MRREFDPVSLIGGLVIAVLGAILMLDQGGDVEFSAGLLAAIFVGAFGLIMLVSGLLDDR
ncbi:MAG TPA: hypothetical protein VHF58_11450 [Solirubrobacterales bacterium]|nr:hypothetical protein [Solirubrobacterales bacterium]